MIKRALFVLVMVGVLSLRSSGDLPEDPAAYYEWEARMFEQLREQSGKPPEEAIPKLGQWLYQLSLPTNRETEGRPVFNAVREALLAIPDHATYYGRRIKDARDKMVAES